MNDKDISWGSEDYGDGYCSTECFIIQHSITQSNWRDQMEWNLN